FSELELRLFPGPRASLASPALCGTYPTSASFTPWSYPFQAPLSLESTAGEFTVGSGPGGTPCPRGEPFEPALSAGSEDRQAGAFSEFTLGLDRPDGNQPPAAISLKLPAGAAAMLSHITPCPEPQASLGSCGPESQIGHASASAGVGPDPYTEQGAVYITGPYQGAPFGLSIAAPAVAGPFDLGTIVVRSTIEVDPHTAQVTISSPVPTFIQGVGRPATGIPLQLQRIQVDVDRPDFEYNPTSCEPKHVEATLDGAGNGVEQVSIPFQVAGCQSLPFKPGVSAQTEGETSKADGASLKLTFKSKSGEAHVAKTILTIPSTLPARLTTIQKACIARVFEANPAACPEGSVIGAATVHTPVLESPLTGPIYLVSHGNAAWPDAELVLQSEGITVILDGQTAIKKGVTTSSFLSVPDAPFESVEATLPEGPHSALTTNLPLKDHYSLCGQHLTIPAALTGQNGTALSENVKVAVQGCHAVEARKAKKLTRKQRLAKTLKACRKSDRHSPAKRGACEHGARAGYTTKRTGHKR
ncbi:MAG TPA: hypothetical protein VMB51_04290, partial [Solirubrobacteraceae bacterium]|nr:hypothetical protein [Solirubrobacteraceae bacterium]